MSQTYDGYKVYERVRQNGEIWVMIESRTTLNSLEIPLDTFTKIARDYWMPEEEEQ